MPKSLDLNRLRRFEPETAASSDQKPLTDPAIAPEDLQDQRWPSREPVADGQISIKGPLATIRRFKALCKADRRTYADMLSILMDYFEHRA